MDVREARSDDIQLLAGMAQDLPPGFPSAESLLRIRQRLDVLMPVALVEAEVAGFGLASLVTEDKRRLGIVRYLLAFVDGGPVANAIRLTLLSRLERQFAALETDEVQLSADHPPTFIDQLGKLGYRLDTSVRGTLVCAEGRRRFVKSLT